MKFQDENIITPQLNTNMLLIVGAGGLVLLILLIVVISLLLRNHKRKRDLMDMVAAGDAQINDINKYFGNPAMPDFRSYSRPEPEELGAKPVQKGFRYASDNNGDWLDENRFAAMLGTTGK
jgi:hypothetical protein